MDILTIVIVITGWALACIFTIKDEHNKTRSAMKELEAKVIQYHMEVLDNITEYNESCIKMNEHYISILDYQKGLIDVIKKSSKGGK